MKVKDAALLQYNEDVEGSIEFLDSFNSEFELLERVDILQDWIDVLRGHYKKASSDYDNYLRDLGGKD